MSISSIATSYAASGAQRMLAALLAQQQGAGQDMPGVSGAERPSGPPPGRPPGPPPAADSQASSQFSSNTLASLLQAQETKPSATDIANKLIGDVDTDGDGKLSLSEIEASLKGGKSGANPANDLSSALAKLDTDGDGKLNVDELTKGLEAMQAKHHRHQAQTAAASTAASILATAQNASSVAEPTAATSVTV